LRIKYLIVLVSNTGQAVNVKNGSEWGRSYHNGNQRSLYSWIRYVQRFWEKYLFYDQQRNSVSLLRSTCCHYLLDKTVLCILIWSHCFCF
jgi:hypothetical protein